MDNINEVSKWVCDKNNEFNCSKCIYNNNFDGDLKCGQKKCIVTVNLENDKSEDDVKEEYYTDKVD